MADTATNLPARQGNQQMITREEYGAVERRLQTELAAITMAAQAKAEVEARFVYAERHPRDIDDVRIRLLAECRRKDFAKAAWYKIPNRGEGFTIRFAESAIQFLGNVYAPAKVIYDDDERRVVQCQVIDLERNVTWEMTTTVTKTVERKNAEGREILRMREKRDGSINYIVRATDEELLTNERREISKAQRTNAMRLIPADIREEAAAVIKQTAIKAVADDPDAERKAIADAFATIKVMPSDIKAFLGCELGQVAPKELVELRQLYMAIREGSTTWREIMADKRGGNGADPEAEPVTLKDRLKTKSKEEQTLREQAEAARARHQAMLDALPVLESFPDAGDYRPGDFVNVKGVFWMRALETSTSEWEQVK